MKHELFMKIALALAEKGKGWTHPNPMVGAVLVKNDKIISWGYHEAFGKPHAEQVALKKAGTEAKDATLYVNLEPCCHFGKTPPCCKLIAEAGVRKVVASISDPNPKVNGKGFAYLRERGIEIVTGVLEKEAEELNRAFLFFHRTGLPWVTGKIALTADGKSARPERWITSEKARELAHQIRAEHQAIMVGITTVLKDDPFLNVRTQRYPGKKITKIVLDSYLRTPPKAKIFSTGDPVFLFTKKSPLSNSDKKFKGAEIVKVSASQKGGLNLEEVLKELAKRGIISVLVEGGISLLSSFIEERLINELLIFQAGKLGGELPFNLSPVEVLGSYVENIERDQILWRFKLVHRYYKN